jgi:hypothetical protein
MLAFLREQYLLSEGENAGYLEGKSAGYLKGRMLVI